MAQKAEDNRTQVMIIKANVKKKWSFSGLATMVRILLLHYVFYKSILKDPEKDWKITLLKPDKSPNQLSLSL